MVTNLDKNNKKLIAFSSPFASEGKSTTAINLAISFAQLNKKVLLIDADAHRPTVHSKMKLKNESGLLTVLSGEISFEDAVQQYSPALDVLTSGALVSNPTELLHSNALVELFDKVRGEYDYILVDAPPVNLLSDAQIVAQRCDGMILLVRAGITTHDALRRALANAQSLYIDVLGIILNGTDYGSKRYYSKYYNRYYNRYYNKYGKY
ncbi:MAG: CpsD/CapB family tyrosine-protein kinase [Clostridia bacterium]|nr:CpsD/CapB family tyrosine-protein kinase [Clostridia bacterium]